MARLQRWADAGWAGSVVFGWGLLQGCVFPGLADLFFLPLAIARPSRAYRLALAATAGTVIGSVALYFVGARALEWLQGPIAEWLGISATHLAESRVTLAKYGAWAIFASTMSPLSVKLTSIASGAVGVPFAQFAAALVTGRLLRTLVFAWLIQHGGAQAVARWTGGRGPAVR
jgi:membrane protein YqaA with SNARE-associated domain